MKKLVFTFGIGLIIASCSPKTAEVAATPTPNPAMTFPSETIASGYATYGSDCIKCHDRMNVKSFTREAWDKILPDMAKKAKLSDAAQAAVNDYINWELAK